LEGTDLLVETVPHRGAHRQRKDFSVRRTVVIALSVMLALVVAIPMASGKPATTVKKPAPPSQNTNLADLTAEWWNWAASINPSP
jgi:hypothetical protein